MELLGEETEATGKEVKTKSILPSQANIGQEEKYYYQFLNNELPLLKENQISLSGIEVKTEDGKVIVKAFMRNSLRKRSRSRNRFLFSYLDQMENHLPVKNLI